MKIDRIELFHVAIPLPKPFHPSWIPGYPQTANRFTLMRVTTVSRAWRPGSPSSASGKAWAACWDPT